MDDFNALYQEQHGRLYAFVVAKTGDRWLAEEVVQRSFIRWWEMSLKDRQGKLDAKKALFMIAKGIIIDERRRHLAAQKIMEGYSGLQNTDSSNGQQLDIKDIEVLITEAISRLPEKRRKIFEMSRFEELSYQEIAGLLGISVSTVEGQMVKAIKSVKLSLEPHLNNQVSSATKLALLLAIGQFL